MIINYDYSIVLRTNILINCLSSFLSDNFTRKICNQHNAEDYAHQQKNAHIIPESVDLAASKNLDAAVERSPSAF